LSECSFCVMGSSFERYSGVGGVQCLLIVVREPVLVVRKRGQPLLELLIFALFVVIDRSFDQITVFKGFRAILL
jgi:hypothetical protein